MRTALRKTGALGEKERPKAVPLTHHLLYKYNVDWRYLVNCSQGDNKEEIEAAQQLLDEVQAAFAECAARDSEAAAALREAAAREHASKKAAEEAAAREADAKAAAAEALAREEDAKAREAQALADEEEAK